VLDVQDRIVELSRIRLHIREWHGPPGASAVVLVHGLSSNARIWDAIAPELATRFRVVALDQRGHGLSDKPEDGYGFDEVMEDLHALVEALEIRRPLLVGHSWGGNVVVQYAATHPDGVAGLVLVDGGFLDLSARPGMTWERIEQELAPPDLTSYTVEDLLQRMRNGNASDYWGPAVEATMRGSFDVGPDGKVRPRLSRANHLKILRALWDQRPSDLYPRVRCDILIVPARRSDPDPRTAEQRAAREAQVARAAQSLPHARVLWMEDTVHDIPLHRPRELAEAIASMAEQTHLRSAPEAV
jgi:pimeloyl-ACP methyl ester carboxylesterase